MKPNLDHYSRRVPAHLPAKVIVPAQEQTGIQNSRAAKRQQRNVVSFNWHYNIRGQRQCRSPATAGTKAGSTFSSFHLPLLTRSHFFLFNFQFLISNFPPCTSLTTAVFSGTRAGWVISRSRDRGSAFPTSACKRCWLFTWSIGCCMP